MNKNGTISYSNIISLQNDKQDKWYSIYPNLVKDMLTLDFKLNKKQQYKISLLNTMGQATSTTSFTADGNSKLQLPRTASMIKGIYILRIQNMETAEVMKEKLIYL